MNSPPTILVIQHSRHETLGTIESGLQAAGLTPRIVSLAAKDEIPGNIGDAQGLIVMGGGMSVYEHESRPHLQQEMRLIESALKANRPVLGICLGSQLLAHVLGAKVYPNQQKEIGWHPVQFISAALADPLWQDAAAEFFAFHWHGDTYDLPRGTVQIGSSSLTPCQGFRYGESSYGLQFHLEVNAESVARISKGNLDALIASGSSLERLQQATDQHLPASIKLAESFFRGWARLASS